jgi:N-acetylglucosamine malate deacetylase 1
MSRSVSAIFAHPDDEVLGCGATLARYSREGDRVSILILATGLTSRGGASKNQIDRLKTDARRSADILGANEISFADFPDNQMDAVPLLDVVQRIETFLGEANPDLVFTHYGADLNIDHRIVAEAVTTALRPQPGTLQPNLLACEVNSSTEWTVSPSPVFCPNEYVVVDKFLDAKIEALQCYTSEIRPWPHPRSAEGIRTQAKLRGSQIGHEAAEAFMSLRRVTA